MFSTLFFLFSLLVTFLPLPTCANTPAPLPSLFVSMEKSLKLSVKLVCVGKRGDFTRWESGLVLSGDKTHVYLSDSAKSYEKIGLLTCSATNSEPSHVWIFPLHGNLFSTHWARKGELFAHTLTLLLDLVSFWLDVLAPVFIYTAVSRSCSQKPFTRDLM